MGCGFYALPGHGMYLAFVHLVLLSLLYIVVSLGPVVVYILIFSKGLSAAFGCYAAVSVAVKTMWVFGRVVLLRSFAPVESPGKLGMYFGL